MKYETRMTSKGTITIAAPIRKALGLKTGQSVKLFVNKRRNVEIDAGISIEEFEKLRDEMLKKVKIPEHLKGLTARELREIAAEEMFGR
jgi:bifunctional DNA-binding transcriptional regulator/antitoxin component of YhaV-PrlF toxin-antitoxin module